MRQTLFLILLLFCLELRAEEAADSQRPYSYRYMAEIEQMLVSDQVVEGAIVPLDASAYLVRGINLGAMLAYIDSMQMESLRSRADYLLNRTVIDTALKTDRTNLRNRYQEQRKALSDRCEAMLDSIQGGLHPTYTLEAYEADLKQLTNTYAEQLQLVEILYSSQLGKLGKSYEADLYFHLYGRIHPVLTYVVRCLSNGYLGADATDACIATQLRRLLSKAAETLDNQQRHQIGQLLKELHGRGNYAPARRQIERTMETMKIETETTTSHKQPAHTPSLVRGAISK